MSSPETIGALVNSLLMSNSILRKFMRAFTTRSARHILLYAQSLYTKLVFIDLVSINPG